MQQNQINEIEEDEIEPTGKSELLKLITCKVMCASMEIRKRNVLKESVKLKIGYSQEEYDLFLNKIDIPFSDLWNWDSMLYGNVWMEDGSWYSVRYDSEYGWLLWEHHKYPEIPDDLTEDYDEVVLLNW